MYMNRMLTIASIVLSILTAILCVDEAAASPPRVIYIPQNFPNGCAFDLTNGQPMCSNRAASVNNTIREARAIEEHFCNRGLNGLDIARQAFGVRRTCRESDQVNSLPTETINNVDLVFLVDDTELTSDVINAVGGVERVITRSGQSAIQPFSGFWRSGSRDESQSFSNASKEIQSVFRGVLVGNNAYTSNEDWVATLTVLANEFSSIDTVEASASTNTRGAIGVSSAAVSSRNRSVGPVMVQKNPDANVTDKSGSTPEYASEMNLAKGGGSSTSPATNLSPASLTPVLLFLQFVNSAGNPRSSDYQHFLHKIRLFGINPRNQQGISGLAQPLARYNYSTGDAQTLTIYIQPREYGDPRLSDPSVQYSQNAVAIVFAFIEHSLSPDMIQFVKVESEDSRQNHPRTIKYTTINQDEIIGLPKSLVQGALQLLARWLTDSSVDISTDPVLSRIEPLDDIAQLVGVNAIREVIPWLERISNAGIPANRIIQVSAKRIVLP